MKDHVQVDLIAELSADLQPVRAQKPRMGWTFLALAVLATLIFVAFRFGFRSGMAEGAFSFLFPITEGILVMLGLAAGAAVIRMANPGVGSRYDGPRWAIAMASILPASALILLAFRASSALALTDPATGWYCSAFALLSSLIVAATLFVWLRRGAPVNGRRAGLYLGISSAALGTAIYGLACPNNTLFHLGIWHMLPVAVGALIGWMVVPRFLRW